MLVLYGNAAQLNTSKFVIEVDPSDSISIECSSPCGILHWTFDLQENSSNLAIIEDNSSKQCNLVTGECETKHVVECPASDENIAQNQSFRSFIRFQPLRNFVLQCIARLDVNDVYHPFYSRALLIRLKRGKLILSFVLYDLADIFTKKFQTQVHFRLRQFYLPQLVQRQVKL